MNPHRDLILNVTDFETRIGVLESDRLVEFYIEHEDHPGLVGRIYKGKVETVIAGLQGAFVNIGLKKNAFLPLSEIPWKEFSALYEPEVELEPSRRRRRITLKEGQEVLCQVVKEPFLEKGARASSYISIPGRALVIMPNITHIGISRRIRDKRHRDRLRNLSRELHRKHLGFVFRTAAEWTPDDEIRKEANALERTWRQIEEQARTVPAPGLVHEDADLVMRLIRDLFTPEVRTVYVDATPTYNRIVEYLRDHAPRLRGRLKLYQSETPIFERFRIDEELAKALGRKVWLRSGGFITIDQTEALAAIDVNTGRFSKESNPERLALLNNLEAAAEVARQIRLRDLSGLVVVDFIDMQHRENSERVAQELQRHLTNDRAKADFTKISEFGILEMTRERTRPSLSAQLTETCPTCRSMGRIPSRADLAYHVGRFFARRGESLRGKSVQVLATPRFADYLGTEWVDQLAALARKYQLALKVRPDATLGISEFRIEDSVRRSEILRFSAS